MGGCPLHSDLKMDGCTQQLFADGGGEDICTMIVVIQRIEDYVDIVFCTMLLTIA
jgi:hypothetical protein